MELPSLKTKKETWSTRKLYELEVIKEKTEGGELYCYVHYKGWSSKYNHWIPSANIVDVPQCLVDGTPDEMFFHSLRIAIKEKLNGNRKEDSLVDIAVPVQKRCFETLSSLGIPCKGGFSLSSFSQLAPLLGKDWFFRIFNEGGDFSHIVHRTVKFYLREREPLQEFVDGAVLYTHRGFVCIFKFVREDKNESHFAEFINSLHGL